MNITVSIPSQNGTIELVYVYSEIRKAHYLETATEVEPQSEAKWQRGSLKTPLMISISLTGQGVEKNQGQFGADFGINEYKGAYANIKKYDILVPYFLTFDANQIHPPMKKKEEIATCQNHEPRFEDRFAHHQTCKFCPATREYVTPETDEKMFDITKYGYSAWKL